MSPEILLVEASTTLVPGATGRTDVARDERAAVVAELRRALGAAGAAGGEGCSVDVLVVAPAGAPRRRWTDVGAADLGAIGVLDTIVSPPSVTAVPLRQAASVAHVVLHLAGWRGPVTTVELGGEELDPADVARILHGDPSSGDSRVVIFATVSSRAGGSSRDPFPSGAPADLVTADAEVLRLHSRSAEV